MLQINHSLQQSEGVLEEICSGLGLDCQLELEVDGKESLRIEGSAGSYRIRAPKEHMGTSKNSLNFPKNEIIE
ncbi:hypothetical protein [Streptococcus suis]|uniref:hypothetical protein n=1 Tax=Streptococcus suis TaxID=1307 RepID=UPI001ABE0A17|nr:hypothetical protein [Streptococcus suis]